MFAMMSNTFLCPRKSGSGGAPSGKSYVAEDNTTFYVAEDGTTFYVQES
jgi:hypothetical protein